MKWIWSSVDAGRAKRASQVKLVSLSTDGDNCRAKFKGSTGAIYSTTLNECTCEDFVRGNAPCKHILRVGMEAGLINRNGLTPSVQLEADILALKERIASASGWYHVFHAPIVSDSEYDSLRSQLASLAGESQEALTLEEFAERYSK